MKKCIHCGKDIEENSAFCLYCGKSQAYPVSNSDAAKPNVQQKREPIKEQLFFDEKPMPSGKKAPEVQQLFFEPGEKPKPKTEEPKITYEADTEREGFWYKLKHDKKTQWIASGVIVLAGLLILGLGALPSLMSGNNSEKVPSSVTENSEISEAVEATTPDNSVNQKGYYYFDNDMEYAINKYREITEKTDNSTIENTLDNIKTTSFSISTKCTLCDTESLTEYNYIYYNRHTSISLFVTDNDKIPAFSYNYSSAVTSTLNYTTEQQVAQLIYKPAKWLYALSDDLTYEKAVDIYKTLYSEHLDAVSDAKEGKEQIVAHHYKGYTMLVNGTESMESVTILKTNNNFIELHNIKAGENSIFKPIDSSDSSENNNTKSEKATVSSNMKKSNNDTTESSKDTDLDYTVEDFGDFYADVPKNWVYEVENGGIYFYEKYNHSHDETGSTGYLCNIKGVDSQNESDFSPPDDSPYTLYIKYLGSSGTIEYYVEIPYNVVTIEDKTASDKTQTAHSQVEDFVDSIVFK